MQRPVLFGRPGGHLGVHPVQLVAGVAGHAHAAMARVYLLVHPAHLADWITGIGRCACGGEAEPERGDENGGGGEQAQDGAERSRHWSSLGLALERGPSICCATWRRAGGRAGARLGQTGRSVETRSSEKACEDRGAGSQLDSEQRERDTDHAHEDGRQTTAREQHPEGAVGALYPGHPHDDGDPGEEHNYNKGNHENALHVEVKTTRTAEIAYGAEEASRRTLAAEAQRERRWLGPWQGSRERRSPRRAAPAMCGRTSGRRVARGK